MKTRTSLLIVLTLSVAAGLVAMASRYALEQLHDNQATTSKVQVQTDKPNESAKEPLTIEAIRQRDYPGSELTIEQKLGNQGGYTTAIVSFQSDGLKQYALMATPAGTKPEGGWPVVILNHGYIAPTEYKTNGSYNSWMAPMAKAGFVVVKPDYRGHASSQGTPEGGHFSPVYTYDVLNLIASLKRYPEVNATRLGMMGHSMGGHVSLRTIVVSPDVKATVLAAGVVGSMYDFFYNWPRSPFPTDRPRPLVQSKRADLVAKYGDPKSNPVFWDSVSSINYVSDIKGKVLVQHGSADTVVPQLMSDHLVETMQRIKMPVEYYTYPGADHNFWPNLNLMLQRSIDFYRANL